MTSQTQPNAWPRPWYAGTIRLVADRVTNDGGTNSMSLHNSDRSAIAAGGDERVGADADDAILARVALVGQVWAQREIWFRFAPMVYSLFRRALGPQHDHDDLIQEVFLRVFRRLHTLEKASALRSFVYSVAVRVVSEEVRRFSVRRRLVAERADLSTPTASSPADFEARETMAFVQRSLDVMRDKYRAVFILRYVDGMDLREISDGLGISLATVKRYLAKAVASIQKSVSQEERKARVRLDTPAAPRLFGGGR